MAITEPYGISDRYRLWDLFKPYGIIPNVPNYINAIEYLFIMIQLTAKS